MSCMPQGWIKVRLGEFAAKTSNVDPSKTPDQRYELWSVPSFSDGRPETPKGEEIRSAKQSVRPGDVLLCKIVPHLNRVWVVREASGLPQIASGEWIVYRDHGCDPHYLRYCLSERSFRERFMETVSGVGGSLMRARPAAVANIEVPIAPRAEQREIVAKLDALTVRMARARDDLDRVPTLAQRYKLAALATAYAPLLELSEPLVGLVDPTRGIPYGIIQTGSPVQVGVRTVRCGDLKAFTTNRDALKIVAQEIADQYERTLLRGGEVLLAIRGSVGEAAVVGPDLVGCNISREVAMIPVAAKLRPKFLMYFLGSPGAQAYLKRHVKGVAQTGINLQDVRTLPVPVPELAVQDAVIEKIEAVLTEIDRLVAEAAAARRLLDRLEEATLVRAFRGELVPQDPADEPASVLLERIAAERSGTSGTQGRARAAA